MAQKGLGIFEDVFRRADKNDDGKISWEEFVAFFADGVMGKTELEEMFKEIDTHNSNNIDTGELCSFFTQHLGEFKEIYGLVETLNSKISNVLHTTAKTYKDAPKTDQFATRFLMREAVNQISALQSPLDSASDHLDTEARNERDMKPIEANDLRKNTPDVVPGRLGRRARRQISNQSNTSEGGSVNPVVLGAQVDRLTCLLDRLEHNVNFGNFVDEDLNAKEDDRMTLIQRDMRVNVDKKEDFRTNLREHIEKMQKVADCNSISVRFYTDSGIFTVYEVWGSDAGYGRSNSDEIFNKTFSSFLDASEPVQMVNFPGSWWKRD